MKIQVVNGYLKYADLGMAPKILCQHDKDHGRLYPELIESEDGDSIVLYCCMCEYRTNLGLGAYQKMYDIVWMYEGMKN
jgi:hypothetical protein